MSAPTELRSTEIGRKSLEAHDRRVELGDHVFAVLDWCDPILCTGEHQRREDVEKQRQALLGLEEPAKSWIYSPWIFS